MNDEILKVVSNGESAIAANSATDDSIKSRIFTIRGVQVMLDRDLAELYGVETGALNRQVKRNNERFPEDFMFRLSTDEWSNLKCQIGISRWGGDRFAIKAVGIFHDRFLILDGTDLYHFGASLKDPGRHYCAVTKDGCHGSSVNNGEKMSMSVEKMENNAFDEIITMIDAARDRAWQAVNKELVSLYWDVGKWLSVKLSEGRWGDKIVDNAAAYLVGKRPDFSGFTKRTLYRAVEFYNTYKADQIVTPLVTQITWTNHLIIMTRAKSPEEQQFEIEKCACERVSKRNFERLFESRRMMATVQIA